jgi:hypothetical protein
MFLFDPWKEDGSIILLCGGSFDELIDELIDE